MGNDPILTLSQSAVLNLYTIHTPKESNLVGPKRIELLSTRCQRIVLAIKLRTNNRFSSDQLSFSRTRWLVSNRRVYLDLVQLLVCHAQEIGH